VIRAYLGTLVAVLVTAVLAGCGGGGTKADLGTVDTDAGTYRIVKVERAAKFPPDCSSDCFVPVESGRDLVAVFVEPEGEGGASPFDCPGKATYLVADDASTHGCTADSVSRTNGDTIEQALLFAVPTSATGFTLRVKGNPPVDLGV